MKHIFTRFSLRALSEHPILTAFLAVFLVMLLFLALLIWQHSSTKRKAQAALSHAQTLSHRSNISFFSTRPFPALIELISPLSGKLLEADALDDRSDFCQCAILPSEGKVYAPFDGEVTALSDSARMLTLKTEGAAVTVLIGNTDAELAQDIFLPCCKTGDKVKEGDLLLSFDLDLLDSIGFDTTAQICIKDTDRFGEITVTASQKVSAGDYLMTLIPQNTPNGSPQ